MRISRFFVPFLAAAAAVPIAAAPASADLVIHVNKSTQTMTVSKDGAPLYVWPVSTGGRGFDTPDGTFTPFRMDKDHRSQEWDNAPMPDSIFFTKTGDAIHGTYEESHLGRPVSHGCVRLSRRHAATLWDLVKGEKMANTKVVLTGHIPSSDAPVVAKRMSPMQDDATAPVGEQSARNWQRDSGYDSDYNDGRQVYYQDEEAPPPPPRRIGRYQQQYEGGDNNGPPPPPFPFGFLFGQ